MSEPKIEEMLKWLKDAVDRYGFLQITHPHLAYYPTDEDKAMYQAICILIEQGKPKMNMEFIKKWGERLFQNTPEIQMNSDIWAIRVKEILREAGWEVRDE